MKKNILRILALILVYVALSVGAYFLLKAMRLNSVNKIRDFVGGFGAWSYVVFFIFQVVVSTFICIIPFEDELLTVSALVLFGPIKGFVIASINMFITSVIQFLLGRYLCKDLLVKLLGDEAIQKYEKHMMVKGEIILPILYTIPLFPHDSLCILAGTSKMKLWYFSIITLIMRTLEIAIVCFFGSGIIDFGLLTVADWILILNVLIIDIYLIFKLKNYIENKINKTE